jgi:hypothetical protein
MRATIRERKVGAFGAAKNHGWRGVKPPLQPVANVNGGVTDQGTGSTTRVAQGRRS